MRSDYSDMSWFFRVVRVVPVIAGAALLGGMIGGFAIYAIDSALTWEPASQPRPEARADNQASANQTSANQTNAMNQQTTKPVRIVGGAIPDPSAGMSGPPPAPQQQRSAAPPASQLSSELLTPKPLGPASRIQSQSTIAGSPQTAPGAPQAQAPQASNQQNQTANHGTIQAPVQTPSQAPAQPSTQAPAQAPVRTQNATAAPQQPTHWPDALSRAHQNAANTQQQTAPATTQPSEPAAGEASTDRAASASNPDDQDRAGSRRDRHSKRHAFVGTNGSRTGTEDDASAAPSPRQQDARSYGRLYDSYGSRRQRSYRNAQEQAYGNAREDQSYGNRRQQSYGNTREQSYGNAREDADDGGYRSETSRSDARRYGRDARSRSRSRVIVREQPEETDRGQPFDARREPFWGGGFFRRGDGDQGDD